MQDHYRPSPMNHVREQVAAYEASDGRAGHLVHGYPCVIVTHVGRRSGAIRKTPLMRVLHGGRYTLVGSFGGGPKDPDWVANLLAEPRATVQDRSTRFEVTARLLTSSGDRKAAWQSAVRAFPRYADFQAMTRREIPVFLCEPHESRRLPAGTGEDT